MMGMSHHVFNSGNEGSAEMVSFIELVFSAAGMHQR